MHDLEFTALRNSVRGDRSLLVPEVCDDIVRQSRYLRIGVSMAECRHEDIVPIETHPGTMQYDLGDIATADVIHATRTQQRGVRCLLALAVPLVAACAGAFEEF